MLEHFNASLLLLLEMQEKGVAHYSISIKLVRTFTIASSSTRSSYFHADLIHPMFKYIYIYIYIVPYRLKQLRQHRLPPHHTWEHCVRLSLCLGWIGQHSQVQWERPLMFSLTTGIKQSINCFTASQAPADQLVSARAHLYLYLPTLCCGSNRIQKDLTFM